MDAVRLCLVLTLCVTFMMQTVLSNPTFGTDNEGETEEFQTDFDPDTALTLERRSVEHDEDNDMEDNSEDFFSRLRRQAAAMAGRPRSSGSGRSRGRYRARLRYNRRRNMRNGKVVSW